jgi:3-hydroxyisobutyrate dehydrogenase and related beta-hydroxyacid dehydrogenases
VERIGLIGLGRMGLAMGKRLLNAGFTLTVWNRTQSKAEPLLAEGAVWANSPSELAKHSDIILTILTDENAVRSVYLGENGLLTGDVSGKLFLEMSTIPTAVNLELAEIIHARKASLLDAPVSGTVGPAREGKLLALVGGSKRDFERAKPIFDVLTRRAELVGPNGSGTTMKLALNLPMAIYWQAVSEALAIATRFGIELEMALDLILDSPAALAALKAKRDLILGAEEEVAFDVTGVRKDLLAMIATGQALGVPMPAASASLISFNAATAAGIGGHDLAKLVPHFIESVNRAAGQPSIAPFVPEEE